MPFSIYQGDPRLFLDENGSFLEFKGGQPVMDQGLENLALISLFTRRGWAGNVLFQDQSQQIGSDFEATAEQPITIQTINDVTDAAEKALESDAFGNVTISVENPSGYKTDVKVTIEHPGQDIQELLISKNGLNWVAQKLFPAYERK